MSAAVVPRWHGNSQNVSSAYRILIEQFDEQLLHGWTHQGPSRIHPITYITQRSDEFRGLTKDEINERIRCAQDDFAILTGDRAKGLLPPAWQLPLQSSEIEHVRFVVRFGLIEDCLPGSKKIALATYSWDWGKIGWLSRVGELLGKSSQRVNSRAVPCIAIHPADVTRGYLKYAVRTIRWFLNRGYIPTTSTQLIERMPIP
jgi:hypothetical protein